jgi:hypothetical protein
MLVLTWILRVLLALLVLGWLATLLKVLARSKNPKWAVAPEDPPCDPAIQVSVVIPARDEAAHIKGCVDAVLAQDHPNLELIVLDDGSTDGTDEILAAIDDPRLKVLSGGDGIPDGWFGKPWALQRAQEHATGDWLMFIDADVRLAPTAVSRVVGYGERNGLGMLTGFGTLTMESFWEHILQPAVGGLILLGNSLDDVNDPEKTDKNMASGQLLAFSRVGYDAAGQHHAVQNNILDDVGLARACVDAGVKYHCLFMRRIYSVRFYGWCVDFVITCNQTNETKHIPHAEQPPDATRTRPSRCTELNTTCAAPRLDWSVMVELSSSLIAPAGTRG